MKLECHITKHFKLTALNAFGFLEIFKVDDPHKISYSNVVKLINSFANCACRKRKNKHSLHNLWQR